MGAMGLFQMPSQCTIECMTDHQESILAVVPNWLGDVAMCTPALRVLRNRFPDAAMTLAGPAAACALLDGLPWFDHVVAFGKRPSLAEMLHCAGVIRSKLGGKAPDLAVVFPHSFRAALLAWLARARVRVGYNRGGRSFLLTDRVEPYRENGAVTPVYMAREYLDLLRPLGCEDDGHGLELRAQPACVERIRSRLPAKRPLIGLAPGAAFGPSKLWPADRYAKAADQLADSLGAQCVVITGPGEEDTRRHVMQAAATPIVECDEGKPSLDTLKATIAQLDLLICNDSGPRHVAVALGVPTVCLMGPTSPRYSNGPYERGRVLRIDVDCGPCQKPVCATDHRCMTGIAVETVVEAAQEVLSAR